MIADGLSRNPVESGQELELAGSPVMGVNITTDWIAAMRRGSEDIMSIRDKLEKGDRATDEQFTMDNTRVYRVSKGRFCSYVPMDLRHELVAEVIPSRISVQSLHIDHAGSFVTTENGNKYFCAIICGFSKYALLEAVKDTSYSETLRMLKDFISHCGEPERIKSDQRIAFYCRRFGKIL